MSIVATTVAATTVSVAKRKIIIKKKDSTRGVEATSLSFRLIDFNIYDVKDAPKMTTTTGVDQQGHQGQEQQQCENGR